MGGDDLMVLNPRFFDSSAPDCDPARGLQRQDEAAAAGSDGMTPGSSSVRPFSI